MLLLIAEDYIKPEEIITVLPLYRELIKETQKEIGCISYELSHDLNDKGHFIFLEKWRDEEALITHTETDHFIRLVALINQHTRKTAKYTRMEMVTEKAYL